ncbi:hypothetical protein CL614_01770 [archaeon]|nr:hypothetical protein [archaeon]|tara:strand:+ start:482 stop:775 length:294 start_codon:yes stop_codon:yes gene_type:complete
MNYLDSFSFFLPALYVEFEKHVNSAPMRDEETENDKTSDNVIRRQQRISFAKQRVRVEKTHPAIYRGNKHTDHHNDAQQLSHLPSPSSCATWVIGPA